MDKEQSQKNVVRIWEKTRQQDGERGSVTEEELTKKTYQSLEKEQKTGGNQTAQKERMREQ